MIGPLVFAGFIVLHVLISLYRAGKEADEVIEYSLFLLSGMAITAMCVPNTNRRNYLRYYRK